MSKRIVIIDNYDSFTFNLFQLIGELNGEFPTVVRNDEVRLDDIRDFDAIVLSPGPGVPSEAGQMPEVISEFTGRIPILGICLGHQAIAEHFGGTLINLESVYHGVAIDTVVCVDREPLFASVPKSFTSGRYHSWVVAEGDLPSELTVTSRDPNRNVMSLRHREHNVVGLQFHPESVLTPDGRMIIENWMGTI